MAHVPHPNQYVEWIDKDLHGVIAGTGYDPCSALDALHTEQGGTRWMMTSRKTNTHVCAKQLMSKVSLRDAHLFPYPFATPTWLFFCPDVPTRLDADLNNPFEDQGMLAPFEDQELMSNKI